MNWQEFYDAIQKSYQIEDEKIKRDKAENSNILSNIVEMYIADMKKYVKNIALLK